jgi:hypothetical protein
MSLSHRCVINSDGEGFESWLKQYHPERDIIDIHDQLIAETFSTPKNKSVGNLQKVIGSPWLKKLPEGDNSFYITLSPDISKSPQEHSHLENCILLTTKNLGNKQTMIYWRNL